MNYNRLVKLNKRQFDRQCNIEGQSIYNFSKNISEKVIFGKTKSKVTQDKTTIYFSADGTIEKGDILLYKNNYYFVQNVNYPENDAWQTSLLVKCNTVWNLFGETVPMVSSELSSVNPRHGTIPTVGGTINFYTKDIPLLHNKISINDVFYDFGGCFKLTNKFFIDGIAFLYFERDTHVGYDFSIKCANNNLNILQKTQAKFYMHYTSNGINYYLPTAKFTYSSSDESVAKIDGNGIITPISTGNFNIIASCTYTFDYGDAITSNDTKEYTYVQSFAVNGIPDDSGSGDTPVTPVENKYLKLTSTVESKVTAVLGGLRKLNCVLYINDEAQDSVPEMATLTYPVINSSGEVIGNADNYIASDSRTTNDLFYVTLEDNDTTEGWVGDYLRVTATLSDGTMGYIDLEITW